MITTTTGEETLRWVLRRRRPCYYQDCWHYTDITGRSYLLTDPTPGRTGFNLSPAKRLQKVCVC